MSLLLELAGVSKRFGGVDAVRRLDLRIEQGEIIGLIGPNGAGKTTLVNLITGVHRPSAGVIRLDGVEITRQRPHEAARRGLARTFQIVQPFPRMTVLENVTAGALFAGGATSPAMARRPS
jgi:branched-chain amino acid transport system ATP-binding protein